MYRLKLSAVADISDDARFSVAVADGGNDWRFANIASVNSKLNSFLSLKVSNTVRYVHAPAPTFETTDTITAIALVAKFEGERLRLEVRGHGLEVGALQRRDELHVTYVLP